MNLLLFTGPSRNWSLAAVILIVLVALVSWRTGQLTVLARQQATDRLPAGYDIGVATKPVPTGQVREFELVVREAPWEIAAGVTVPAVTYNGEVPGPLIRVTEGDTLRVIVKNELDQATSVHWHGLHHTENEGVEPGGLIQIIQYEGIAPAIDFAAPTPMPESMPGMNH
jgi:FtsP/CotA-like multicopper oxidase with cupredoxin domain